MFLAKRHGQDPHRGLPQEAILPVPRARWRELGRGMDNRGRAGGCERLSEVMKRWAGPEAEGVSAMLGGGRGGSRNHPPFRPERRGRRRGD